MEILISDIPEGGLHLHFDSSANGWFQETLADSLGGFFQKEDGGMASFEFYRTGVNVHCMGEVRCDFHPVCCRCVKIFPLSLKIPIHLNLAPLYENERQVKIAQKGEVELVKEDLDFAFYEGNQFNLSELIHEQIILTLPMQPLCREECKGLCPSCGKDLNEGPCGCPAKTGDPRWGALKGLKGA